MNVQIGVGDITKQTADVIVNFATEDLSSDYNAIHKEAGADLEKECLELMQKRGIGLFPTGKAIVTSGYNLSQSHVIHTVAPNTLEGESVSLLQQCYLNSLFKADELGAKSIVFPAISVSKTGISISECAAQFQKAMSSLNALKHVVEIQIYFTDVAESKEFGGFLGVE